MKISAVIITKNEEKNIDACLQSVSFCDEIVIVDSGSQDQTLPLAERYTKRIFSRPFDNFSAQKNFAISHAENEWILSIDADERISESLAEEIQLVIQKAQNGVRAYSVLRKNYQFGKLMRFGANRNDRPIRLFRKDAAEFQGIIHESLAVDGHVAHLDKPMLHYSTQTLRSYMNKLNQYTDLEAKLLYDRGEAFSLFTFLLKPPFRFVQRYIAQGAVFDGVTGLTFSLLSSFYEVIRYAKLRELQKRSS